MFGVIKGLPGYLQWSKLFVTHPSPTNTSVIFKCLKLFLAIFLVRRTRYTLLHARIPKNLKQPDSVRSPRGLKASNAAGIQGKSVHVEGFPENVGPPSCQPFIINWVPKWTRVIFWDIINMSRKPSSSRRHFFLKTGNNSAFRHFRNWYHAQLIPRSFLPRIIVCSEISVAVFHITQAHKYV